MNRLSSDDDDTKNTFGRIDLYPQSLLLLLSFDDDDDAIIQSLMLFADAVHPI